MFPKTFTHRLAALGAALALTLVVWSCSMGLYPDLVQNDSANISSRAVASNLAQGKTISASSNTQSYVAANANDGNTSSYWEGAPNSYPNTLTVSLGSDSDITQVILYLPPPSAWATRTQTLSVLGHAASTGTFSTLVPSATYTFNPATGNTVTINLTARVNTVQLAFTANSGATGAQVSEFQVWGTPVSAPPPAQGPYGGVNRSVADGSVIQAEDYDVGGEGVAYHDASAGNTGGAYRTDSVDIENATDTSGTYDVGWADDGEWLDYTVNTTAATYNITARVASAAGVVGDLQVSLDGAVLGTIAVDATGGWQTYVDKTLNNIVIPAGTGKILQLKFVNGGAFNLNYVKFAAVSAPPPPPPSGRPYGGVNRNIADGAVIQTEDYDLGGEGVGYHDTTTGNTGGAYRADNVDIEATGDTGGGSNVGWIVDGEWWKYTVNATAGTYTITARVASAGTTVGDLQVLLDGAVLGTISVDATGGWQTYVDKTLNNIVVPAGTGKILQLKAVNGGDFNVNFVKFSTGTPPPPPPTGGDVIGKITVGYQAWFSAAGDGSPMGNGWWHYTNDWGVTPSIAQNRIQAWPDNREYTNLYTTAYPNLGSGQSAKLFSSYDQQTINTQVSWMKQYGVDTAALQRFNPTGSEGPIRDAITAKVKTAAEAYGVKFYIMYDVSGWTNMQSEIKNDWTTKMSAYTSSSAYARQGGKPVVCIWGFGFNDNNHPWDAATCLDVVNWFKAQGVYLIGGVPREWRIGINGSRSGFLGTYHAFNMLSPWMVGAVGNIAGADWHYTNELLPDQADCNANGIAYQPCVLPGGGGQRVHGDFMWRQFYNTVRAGAQGIYISMFDEYNEGNQIAKTAEDQSMSPTGTSNIFFTLDEDGTHCSSDYYLRLTGDGGKMLKGQIALTSTRPTPVQ